MSKFGANICTDVCSRRLSVLRCEQFFGSKARGKLRASRNRMQRYQRSIDTVYYVTYRIPLNNAYVQKARHLKFQFSVRLDGSLETHFDVKIMLSRKTGSVSIGKRLLHFTFGDPQLLTFGYLTKWRRLPVTRALFYGEIPITRLLTCLPQLIIVVICATPEYAPPAKILYLRRTKSRRRGVPFHVGDIRPSG